MRTNRTKVIVPCCLLFAAGAASAASFLGPTPYLSSADSPLSAAGASYFYLENFEGGALSTPGVTTNAGSVANPGPYTDSVDGDDGAIDGSGARGHSWYSSPATQRLEFTFDGGALGGLPTEAGVVWTDVANVSPGQFGITNVTFEAFDENGLSLGTTGPFLLGDGLFTGQTSEDRFFGALNAGGISRIALETDNSVDWEVDHLQYGRVTTTSVPEPCTMWLLAAALPLLKLRGKR
jgi:hypothetical protein